MNHNNTKVSYRQRDYAAANLEPGDYVAVRAQQDRDGRYFTNLITVKKACRTGGGYEEDIIVLKSLQFVAAPNQPPLTTNLTLLILR